MKRLFVVVVVSTTLLAMWAGCSKESADGQASTQDIQIAQRASHKLISDFQKELKTELIAALNEAGSAHAIEVCQERAPEIGRTATGSPLVTIKRISDRNRNSENAASKTESAVLAKFAVEQYPEYVDEWVTVDSVTHYRYYQPIFVQSLCLRCHGPHNAIDDGTAAAIASLYPDDKAIEYSVGDLRGMFVVDMVWPDAKEYVADLAASTESK